MEEDMKCSFFSQEELQARVKEIGAQITEDYKDKEKDGIVVLSILNGAVVFMADLIRAIDLKLEIDFMCVSSYGNTTSSNGRPRIDKDASVDMEGKHVIIAEDIVDSGLTLYYVCKLLAGRGAKSVKIAALLHKHVEKKPLDIEYICFDCPNEFIVGYGLDFAQVYRNFPYIGVLKSEVYAKALKDV